MENRRSYLDTLNAGRTRRPAAIEDLNRTLEELENRFGPGGIKGSAHAGGPMRQPERRPQPPAPPMRRPHADETLAQAQIAAEVSALREELHQQMTTGLRREFDGLRGDIERVYTDAASGVRAPELGAELEQLSHAIRSLAERSDDRGIGLLRSDLDELKQALGTLAREDTVRISNTRWDEFDQRWTAFEEREIDQDPAIDALAQRLEQISDAVAALPDSLALRSLDEKVRTLATAVDQFSRQRLAPQAMEAIEERLDEISRAIVASTAAAQMPTFNPEPFERVEARIAQLSRQIEEVAEDKPMAALTERLVILSERIGEISQLSDLPTRAVERLAQQVALIAGKIDSGHGAKDAEMMLNALELRFAALSDMIEERHAQAANSGRSMFAELDSRIQSLSERLAERDASGTAILDAIDARFADLSGELQRDAKSAAIIEAMDVRFTDLSGQMQREARSTAVLEAIDTHFADLSAELQRDARGAAILDAIDARFTDLSAELQRDAKNAAIIDAIDARFTGLSAELQRDAKSEVVLDAIDARFTGLSDQMHRDAKGAAIIDAIDARFTDLSAGMQRDAALASDPAALRSLEKQIAELSSHLKRPAPAADMSAIAPRLDSIETSIVAGRDAVMHAAREAADDMARSFSGAGADTAAVTALAGDLKSLDALARRSDDRNSRTFEAIHDTLLKIVDRLGSLDTTAREAPAAIVDRPTLDDSPSIDPAVALGLSGSALPPARQPARSPAEAAARAAEAAMKIDADEQPKLPVAVKRKSMLGGLSRALKRETTAAPVIAPTARGVDAPEVVLDEPIDARQLNQPLEPGSGAPDLNAIMKRVREERAQPVKPAEADAAKSDFIAAARRAAQAAAAEAGTLKGKADVSGRFGIGDLFRAQRKPILMAAAAIMIALTGLQFGKSFLLDETSVAAEPEAFLSADVSTVGSTAAPAVETDEAPEQLVAVADEPAVEQLSATEPADPSIEAQTSEAQASEEQAADERTSAVETAASRDAEPADLEPELPAIASQPAESLDPVETTSGVPSVTASLATPSAESAPAPVAVPATAPVSAPLAPISVPAEAGPLPLREAAAAGNPEALFEVATRYAEARGVKEDLAVAATWYERAADAGFAPAQYRIGNYYEKGTGVARDVGKAKTWYQLAAAQGNASAMHNLAVLFAMGADGTADNDSAARWFVKAAELGVKDSQFNLGILAAKGVGMPQNLEESYKWFALVAKGGDKDAATKRDEIANSLTAEQLGRARATTELWKAIPLDPKANAADVPDEWTDAGGKTASIDMRQAVRNVQMILNKNGYDAGGADGMMGARTKTAIARFQQDHGLAATGAIDEPLVAKLLEKK